jgi:hypothetical protein
MRHRVVGTPLALPAHIVARAALRSLKSIPQPSVELSARKRSTTRSTGALATATVLSLAWWPPITSTLLLLTPSSWHATRRHHKENLSSALRSTDAPPQTAASHAHQRTSAMSSATAVFAMPSRGAAATRTDSVERSLATSMVECFALWHVACTTNLQAVAASSIQHPHAAYPGVTCSFRTTRPSLPCATHSGSTVAGAPVPAGPTAPPAPRPTFE